jgi:hypothetical protein
MGVDLFGSMPGVGVFVEGVWWVISLGLYGLVVVPSLARRINPGVFAGGA